MSLLEQALALRGLSRAELLERAPDASVEEDVRYEKLRPVARVRATAVWPGYLYFDGDRQVMVYAGDPEGADPDALAAQLGPGGHELRSRAGKRAVQRVWPEQGVAFSEEDGAVDFLEVFEPTTLAEYQARIYEDPGEFIR
jgi:hypothetical protein